MDYNSFHYNNKYPMFKKKVNQITCRKTKMQIQNKKLGRILNKKL